MSSEAAVTAAAPSASERAPESAQSPRNRDAADPGQSDTDTFDMALDRLAAEFAWASETMIEVRRVTTLDGTRLSIVKKEARPG